MRTANEPSAMGVLMKRLVVLAALAAVSCVSDPPPTSFLSPDGRQAFAINCSQSGLSACYIRAREACGGDYEIMRTVDGSVPVTNPGTGQLVSLNDQRLYAVCASSLGGLPKPSTGAN